jgi:hypothetical protein
VPAVPNDGHPAADAWCVEPEDAKVMVFSGDACLSLPEIYSASSEPVTTWLEPRSVRR